MLIWLLLLLLVLIDTDTTYRYWNTATATNVTDTDIYISSTAITRRMIILIARLAKPFSAGIVFNVRIWRL